MPAPRAMVSGHAPCAEPGRGGRRAPVRGDRGSSRGGRYWVRTSDLFRVREARYRCANRPCGAVRRRRRWVRDSNPCTRLCRPLPRLSANPPGDALASYGTALPTRGRERRSPGADDRIRTGDPHLGKVMLYQLSYVRRTGIRGSCRGRYWDRTSDLFRVKEARYPCANRPKVLATLSSGLEEAYTVSRGACTRSGVTYVLLATERSGRPSPPPAPPRRLPCVTHPPLLPPRHPCRATGTPAPRSELRSRHPGANFLSPHAKIFVVPRHRRPPEPPARRPHRPGSGDGTRTRPQALRARTPRPLR